jgi:ubiquitin carboxyl-terminal hydrolase 34
LAAHDSLDMDMQNYNGQDIDDNFLHQMMNMFGFLQMSDRQYYNPVPFCFSFKSFDGEPTNVREQKDAQEFLNVGFDRLENLLKNTS